MPKPEPRIAPCFSTASMKYWLHVGVNLQRVNHEVHGEMHTW